MLGFGGDTEISQQILAGEANINNITNNKAGQLLLQSMTRDTAPINLDFTATNMINKYKKWKEKTVTPVASGQHLGHFYALFQVFEFSNGDDYEAIVEKKQAIIDLHYLMLCISDNNKYVSERWKMVVTQMIEKDPGSPKINRLCVIHLYKCDLNLLIGLYFRKLSQHLEDNKLLNPGTYSRHPNCHTIDPIIINITQTETAMVTRHPLIWCNNDLKQCFDHIMSHLTQLNHQSFGLPSNIAKNLGNFLEQVIYKIKTAMGVSDRSYSHTRENGVFGTG